MVGPARSCHALYDHHERQYGPDTTWDMLMSEIKNASFLDVVPVERLSRSHGKRGCHRLIRHDTPSAAGDSARPSNRTGPLTESRRTRQINLFSTLSDLSRPSFLCPTNSVGLGGKESKACKIEARTCHRERRHTEREREPLSGLEQPHRSRTYVGLWMAKAYLPPCPPSSSLRLGG